MKIFKGVSNSENMVFDVKKLLNIVMYLRLQQRDEKKRPRRNDRQILHI
jgi:hypothetical protein